jgi:hypothetical protein
MAAKERRWLTATRRYPTAAAHPVGEPASSLLLRCNKKLAVGVAEAYVTRSSDGGP